MVDTLNRYDIWNVATRANPQALYEQMRREDPVYCAIGPVTKRNFWFFTRYQDCVAVLKDPRFGKEFYKHLSQEQIIGNGFGDNNDAYNVVNRHLLNLDPPDHTRLRGLIHKAFTPRMVENLRGRIQQIADELVAQMQGQQQVDLIASYALPLPITVIAEMLGIPASDQAKFRAWTDALLTGTDEAASLASVMEFAMYMHEQIDQRHTAPRDDLISALVQVEEAGETLNREELLSMIFLLLVAGHETTVNLIANGTLALMQHPDQQAQLARNPELINTAVEEMLRYNGPVETPTLRWAFEDVELGGKVIAKGDIVMPSLLAANRDPEVFADPNRFDITRSPNPHIAFGFGIHYCVGAPLARLEGAIAINTLLRNFPAIDLAVPVEQLQWNDQLLIHGMKTLPVSL